MPRHPWILTFGILGNITSTITYLAPMLTFFRVYKRKSTEGFHSIPYLVALFSAMLWVYYATLNSSAFLLLTLNCFGFVAESFYIAVFIFYAPRKAKMLTLKLVLLLNIGGSFLVFVPTYFLVKGSNRLRIIGWICGAFTAAAFAAPLSIMIQVVRTRNVEFMPFFLSLFLTLSGVMWSAYGVLLSDPYVMVPNIVGVFLGAAQMVLYAVYKWGKKAEQQQQIIPQQIDGTQKHSPIKTSHVVAAAASLVSQPSCNDIEVGKRDHSGVPENPNDKDFIVAPNKGLDLLHS